MDQAAIGADFDFRRYATKPTPAKPRIIMAQVAGSGTAATDVSRVRTAAGASAVCGPKIANNCSLANGPLMESSEPPITNLVSL